MKRSTRLIVSLLVVGVCGVIGPFSAAQTCEDLEKKVEALTQRVEALEARAS